MIELIANDETYFSDALILAVQNDHDDIVDLLIQNGAQISTDVMDSAIVRDNLKMIEKLMDHGYSDFSTNLLLSASYGKTSIIEWIIERTSLNIRDHYELFDRAYGNNHIQTARVLFPMISGIDDYLVESVNVGNLDVIDRTSLNIRDHYELFDRAYRNNHIQTARVLFPMISGIDDYLVESVDVGNLDVIEQYLRTISPVSISNYLLEAIRLNDAKLVRVILRIAEIGGVSLNSLSR